MNPRRADVALCLGVIVVLTVVVSSDIGNAGSVNPLAYIWAVGLGLLMLVRRSHPILVLVLTTLGFFSYYAAGFSAIGVGIPMAAALFCAAEAGHLRAAVAASVLVLGWSTIFRLAAGQAAAFVLGYELVSHAALVAAAIALGHNVRVGRALRRRTEQVSRLLVRQGELDADARLREERLALARELHDSIGHSLSVAALYTQVAREVGPDADGSTRAHDLVRNAILNALTHLRGTVTVLRGAGTPVNHDLGLDTIDQLLAAPRAAGYEVDVAVSTVAVPPEVGVAAYRVVQEAVTNVIRHSSGSQIRISVAERPEGVLEVLVDDDGQVLGGPDLRPGHGLSGMRERLQNVGGSLEVSAGPRGWRVRALIPTMEAS